MIYHIEFSERARKELSDAWEWYEARLPGLGDRFVDAVYKRLKYLELQPSHGAQHRKPYREIIVKVFPYLIIYRVEEKEKTVFIHSIFHMSRNPGKKYSAQ